MKKDRNGIEIKLGNVVVSAITLNHDLCFTPFITMICQKNDKGVVVLNGIYSWIRLSEVKSHQVAVITERTNLSDLALEFIKEFDKNHRRPTPRKMLEVFSNLCTLLKIGGERHEGFPVTRDMVEALDSKIDALKKIVKIDRFNKKSELADALDKASRLLQNIR